MRYKDDWTGEKFDDVTYGNVPITIHGLALPKDGGILLPGNGHLYRHFANKENAELWMREYIRQVDEIQKNT